MTQWHDISTAPRDGTVIVVETRGGDCLRASWGYIGEDEDGTSYGWVADIELRHPPSWTDGACWAVNEDDEPSDPPLYWTHVREDGA